MKQEFVQSIEDTARAVTDEIHTAMPAIIKSFNSSTGVASVLPIGKYRTSDGKNIDYPMISNVPVIFPHSANAGMTFPILNGDSCLLVISEIELDKWRTGAESEGVLKFDLTNAICIPGLLKPQSKRLLEAYRNDAIVMYTGSTEMAVTSSGVIIKGSLTVSGQIVASGDMIGAGTSLKEHKHISGEAGNDTSSPR